MLVEKGTFGGWSVSETIDGYLVTHTYFFYTKREAIAQFKHDTLKTYRLVWSPEGKEIARVRARDKRAAIRMAPKPYRRYLGEIYAEEMKS